jgi:hypothetical protein
LSAPIARQGHRDLGAGIAQAQGGLQDVLVVAVDDRRDRRPVETQVRPEAFLPGRVRDGFREDDDLHRWGSSSDPWGRRFRALGLTP